MKLITPALNSQQAKTESSVINTTIMTTKVHVSSALMFLKAGVGFGIGRCLFNIWRVAFGTGAVLVGSM